MSLVYSRSRKKASVVRPVPEEERGVRCEERNWKGPILQVLVPKRKGFGLRSGCDGSQQGCWMVSASRDKIEVTLFRDHPGFCTESRLEGGPRREAGRLLQGFKQERIMA